MWRRAAELAVVVAGDEGGIAGVRRSWTGPLRAALVPMVLSVSLPTILGSRVSPRASDRCRFAVGSPSPARARRRRGQRGRGSRMVDRRPAWTDGRGSILINNLTVS